jgi:hypothetical protein
MTPLEEAKDLIANPLLSDAMVYTTCPSSQVLQNIAYLQEMIDLESDHLKYIQNQIGILKGRAISENIEESGNFYLLKIPGKKFRNQIPNLLKFKEEFPGGYAEIRKQQLDDIEDAYKTDKLNIEDSAIPLGLADKKIGMDRVTKHVGYQVQKVTVEVRRKQERLQ